MDLSRRGWMGFAALGAAGLAAPAVTAARFAVQGGERHHALLERLGHFAAAEIDALGIPGMSVAISGPDGLAATLTVGLSELERRLPVAPTQLFQIGSISKSLVALALHRIADRGRFSLDATVASLLPELPIPADVTVQALLDHVSGLPGNAPLFPREPDALWTGPSRAFAYSNTGYAVLGLVLARVSGTSVPAALRAQALAPLGMMRARPVIVGGDRDRYAVGYVPLRQDGPPLPRAPLAQGPWIEFDNPAGSVAATGPDMIAYLRGLAGLAAGTRPDLLSPAMRTRFLRAGVKAPDFGADATYANGLATIPLEGRPCLHHTGGMLTFSSAMIVDPKAGVGCMASANVGGIGYRPKRIATYGALLARSLAEGRPLPEPPSTVSELPVEAAPLLAGRFLTPGMPPLVIMARNGQLAVEVGGRRAALVRRGPASFATDHPDYRIHLLDFGELHAGERPDRLWWGERLYGRDRALPTPVPPERLRRCAGLYISTDPWVGGYAVLAREERLLIEGWDELVPAHDGTWRLADPASAAERILFDRPVNGSYQRMNLSGVDIPRLAPT